MSEGEMVGPFSIKLQHLPANNILIGSDKGSLPYSSERPRHEVRLSKRWIMQSHVSAKLWQKVMQETTPTNTATGTDTSHATSNTSSDFAEGYSWEKIEEFLNIINEASNKMDIEGEWRLPSESEWQSAQNQLSIFVPEKKEEVLSDHPHPNYRGASTDGRPRIIENPHSMMRLYRVSRMAHPNKKMVSIKSQASIKNGQSGQIFRLIFVPSNWQPSDVLVPDFFNLKRLASQEILIALIIGILPSFAIPIVRGMGSYAITGWVNLLFGGLCLAFASSLFWRPRTPTWEFTEDGNSMQETRLKGKKLLK